MSNSEPESLSERELAEELFENVFSGKPRSPSEAIAAADEDPTPLIEDPPGAPGDELEPEPPPPVQPDPVPTEPVVDDSPGRDTEKQPEPVLAEAPALEEEEPQEVDELEDENIAWAKGKYGDDPSQWAKAARHQERHISTLANEKREAEELAVQWYQYSQQLERQGTQMQQAAMPMSSAEEEWVEQSVANPVAYARNAIMNGNPQLYHAVVARVAEENPMLAAQIGTQIQMELQELAAREEQQAMAQQPQMNLGDALGHSFVRLGIDLQKEGPAMSEKIAELGEYHPYVQALLNGDQGQRDLAVQAVHDLVRAGTFSTRKVRDEAKAEQLRREGELRREAAGVVTGAPHTPPPKEDPFMAAMEEEWRARRQWGEE